MPERNLLFQLVFLFNFLLVFYLVSGCASPAKTLILATTTSVNDSGLLELLLPAFEKVNNAEVKVLVVGSGQAIKLGERGDADVLLLHDPRKEGKFVAEGYGVQRSRVMRNDFVIVGPEADPAGVKNAKKATQAFSQIATSGALFISRGDNSGTHAKEIEIWERADIKPEGKWYLSVGQGMGETLTIANQKLAYTLSDRGTFLSRKKLDLIILLEGDEDLINLYHVIAVNPQKHSHVKYDLALKFIEFITSYETQKIIGEFGRDKHGHPLFLPDSDNWHKGG